MVQTQHSGGRSRWMSELEASLVYIAKFQDSQGYIERTENIIAGTVMKTFNSNIQMQEDLSIGRRIYPSLKPASST